MPPEVHPSLVDRHDLSFFSDLQDQRAVLAEARRQTKEGISQMMGSLATPGKPSSATGRPAIDTEVETDDMAIINRSPTTNITNNYGGGLPAWFWALLAAAVLVAALIAGVFWLLSHSVPSQNVPDTPAIQSSGSDYGVGFFDN